MLDFDHWREIWEALSKNKLRTFLTLVSIVTAFLLSGVAALISAVVASRLHPLRRALPDGRPDPLVEI